MKTAQHLYSLFIVIFLSTFLIGCEIFSENNSYKVKGTVLYKGSPVNNAEVSIDNKLNYKTSTDENGTFTIEGVSEGVHELNMSHSLSNSRDQTSSSFTEQTFQIEVNDDVELDAQSLPNAIELYSQSQNSTSLEIGWGVSDDEDFREYKLYRHSSSGLDETTGELVHVSTFREDTLFLDQGLLPLTKYFYRVYVMDNEGRIGGSNIIDTSTLDLIVIKNGGFESVTNGDIDNWGLSQSGIAIDNIVAFQGENSLSITNDGDENSYYEKRITQYIEPAILSSGAKYRLTFSHNSDFSESGDMFMYLRNSVLDIDQYVKVDFSTDSWNTFAYDLTLPNEIGTDEIEFQLFFLLSGGKKWWIDEVELVKIN